MPTGVRGGDFVCFYDWNEGRLVRRIDVGAVKDVIWSDNGELVAIAGDASFYILQVGVTGCQRAARQSSADVSHYPGPVDITHLPIKLFVAKVCCVAVYTIVLKV